MGIADWIIERLKIKKQPALRRRVSLKPQQGLRPQPPSGAYGACAKGRWPVVVPPYVACHSATRREHGAGQGRRRQPVLPPPSGAYGGKFHGALAGGAPPCAACHSATRRAHGAGSGRRHLSVPSPASRLVLGLRRCAHATRGEGSRS
jgi:hypothetical protein